MHGRGSSNDRPLPPQGPVLALCGWSGSGKTTALRELIPELAARGLSVATVKHDAHGIDVDPEGKDSDRLFKAGADVILQGPGQSLIRTHSSDVEGLDGEADLYSVLTRLLRRYDLVLVEGHKGTPLPKIWIGDAERSEVPEGVTQVREVLTWNGPRRERLLALVEEWLPAAWLERPVMAGVLVGGPGSQVEAAILERTVNALSAHAEQVVLLGAASIPGSLSRLPRLVDPPGLGGPLAGILGAMRWAPDAAWLVSAHDHPLTDDEALCWLLDQQRPGIWAILPQLGPEGVEPTLAIYDARARRILESMAAGGVLAPSALASNPRTLSPAPPEPLAGAWRDREHS